MAEPYTVTITGLDGFIGKSIQQVVDWKIYRDLRPDANCIVHLGAPSSHEQFKQDMDGCFENTINTFLHVIQYSRDYDIPLVYASSITAEKKVTPYGKCKAICEEIAKAYDVPSLGVRIVCGYGENEIHKDYYASVVYKFCKDMKAGNRPVVFGNGEQSRDFIYQSDIAEAFRGAVNMVASGDFPTHGIVNAGTGRDTSFNELIRVINDILGTNIEPEYVDKPEKYVEHTSLKEHGFFATDVVLEEGVQRVLNSLKEVL